MSLARIKLGDTVQVTTGREKGKIGKILKVLTKKNRVVVEGLNMVKRHSKPRKQGDAGGIIEKAGSIAVSNVMPVDPKGNDRGVRVGTKMTEDKKGKQKFRISRKSGEVLDESKK